MNQFILSGKSVPTANYVACRRVATQTYLTGFDTFAEARQYVAIHETRAADRLTLAIVKTSTDELVYYRRCAPPRPRLLAQFLSLFL